MFWTLGGQQVGKAAIAGWCGVLAPGLRDPDPDLRIWPFSGELRSLLEPGRVVVTETYPAEVYAHLAIKFSAPKAGMKSGKRCQADRARNAGALLAWGTTNQITLNPELHRQIIDGFGPRSTGEDPFDAVIGLFGMLNVLLGKQPAGEPESTEIRAVEGWILGQRYPAEEIGITESHQV